MASEHDPSADSILAHALGRPVPNAPAPGISLAASALLIVARRADGLRGADALRPVWQFMDDYHRAAPADRPQTLAEPPAPTGDPRYDALLAGLAEHLCAGDDRRAPAWCEDRSRFLDRWWFVAEMASFEAAALTESPISLARHGVFVTSGFFERV